MDFDKFKKDWKKDTKIDNQIDVRNEISKLRSSMHPVDKLKRNMRQEFYAQVLALLILAFFPVFFKFGYTIQIIFYASYIIFSLISIYYLATFYRFYNEIQQYSGTTKTTLQQLYTSLLLNMERYKAFGFLLVPFVISWISMYTYHALLKKNRTLDYLTEEKITLIFIIIAVATSGFMLSILLWVKFFYEKYTKQIKSVLDELEDL